MSGYPPITITSTRNDDPMEPLPWGYSVQSATGEVINQDHGFACEDGALAFARSWARKHQLLPPLPSGLILPIAPGSPGGPTRSHLPLTAGSTTTPPPAASLPREAVEILRDLTHHMSAERYQQVMGELLTSGTANDKTALLKALTGLLADISDIDTDVQLVIAFIYGVAVGREHLTRGYTTR